jgi:hypothetical protein
MHKRWVFLGLALVLAAGCCRNPGLFQKVQRSLDTVQSYYSPLLEKEWQNDEKMRRAVVAADTMTNVTVEVVGFPGGRAESPRLETVPVSCVG